MGKTNETPKPETRFMPCQLCKSVTSEYEIQVMQISTSKLLAVLYCCAECAGRAV